jgi:hypothetical protein
VLGPSIVTGIQIVTANDFPNRDPLTVSIEGTNATSNYDAGATWTLIADNVDLGIATDPGRQSYGPIVRFANATAYRSYRVIIKSQRGSDIGVQYAELNLVGGDAIPPRVQTAQFLSTTDQAVVVQFSEDVGASLTAADLLVENVTAGATVPAAAITVSWDGDSRTARWTFPGYPAGLPDGRYRATLAAGNVSNPAGSSLASPITLNFGVLAGDATGNGRVDFGDLVLLAQNYNTTGGRTYADGDFNFDHNVDFEDLVLLAQRYNTSLPVALVIPTTSAARAAPVESRGDPGPVFSVSPIARSATVKAQPTTRPKLVRPRR